MTKTNRKTSAPAVDAPSQPPPATGEPHAKSAETATPKGKLGALVELLRAPKGASLAAMMAATGWQAHSVRGALSGALKKKRGLVIDSEKTESGRVWRIAGPTA